MAKNKKKNSWMAKDKKKNSWKVDLPKIKVLAYCDSPTCATGFGTVSRNIFEGLYNTGRYQIDILGINYWGDPHEFPYRIWPTGTNQQKDPYGRQKVCNMIPGMEYDILFFLQDTFILDFLPELIPYLKKNGKKFKSISYYPIDGEPKEKWIKNISVVDYPIAYSQFGKDMSEKMYKSCPDVGIIPHGVNVRDYFPMPREQVDEFRSRYFGYNADKFIFMNLNRNQQRKDIPRTIQAFVEFRKQVPESILYLHCAQKDQGWDLVEVCKSFGLDTKSDVIFPQNFGPNQGYPRQVVNLLYNSVDCVVSTTLGEGWGLCLYPRTNIYTDKGISMMSELTIDDRVLSSDGNYNEIEGIMSRDFDGELYEITTWLSNIPILTSPEHKFKVFNGKDYVWKDAESLAVGDELLFPKQYELCADEIDVLGLIKPYLNLRRLNNVEERDGDFRIQSNFKKEEHFVPKTIKISPSLMRLFGLYLAEGSLSSNKKDGIAFSFNSNEEDLITFVESEMFKVFGLVSNDITSKDRYNVKTIKFYSSVLHFIFYALFGHGARNKKIHSVLLNQNKELIREFLYGEFLGDGHYSETTYEFSFSTTSKHIAYSLRLMLARLGVLSSVRNSRVEYKVNVSGISKERLLGMFGMEFPDLDRTRATESCTQNNEYLLLPIKSINKVSYSGKLLDIQVANTHDFVAENCVVHNSWSEAMATKTPIIMPRNTALVEAITEDKGYLVNSGTNPSLYTVLPHDNEVIRPLVDVEDMVSKMLEVYNDYDAAMVKAERAYGWVTNDLAWGATGPIVKRWIEVFDEAYRAYVEDSATPEPQFHTEEKKEIESEQI